MRAARIHRYGPPSEFRIEEIEKPAVGPRDVLVEVHATSVNPIDWKIREGGMRAAIRYRMPVVLGMDLSGVIVEVGREATRFRVGDEVHGSPSHQRQGTYAEYVAVDERELAPKPKRLSHPEAAGVPLVAQTAWDCLVGAARLRSGEKALVTAGAGGVGSIAIQIAKHLGATVATTTSPRNAELVRALGADVVVDYTSEAVDERIRDYDVVLDAFGGEQSATLLRCLKRGGRMAAITVDLPSATKKYGALLGLARTAIRIASFTIGARVKYGVRVSFVPRRPITGCSTLK